MLGASSEDIARHIGWCSTAMVDHYTRANKLVPLMDTAEELGLSILSSAAGAPAPG